MFCTLWLVATYLEAQIGVLLVQGTIWGLIRNAVSQPCPEPTESAPVFLTRSPRLDVQCSLVESSDSLSWLQIEFPGELVKVMSGLCPRP